MNFIIFNNWVINKEAIIYIKVSDERLGKDDRYSLVVYLTGLGGVAIPYANKQARDTAFTDLRKALGIE